MKNNFLITLLIVVGLALSYTGVSYAGAEFENPLGTDSFEDFLKKVTDFLFIVSIPIVSIMILYGGFTMLISGGNEEKIKKGKKIILYAVVGFVIVILSGGVAMLIQEVLG